MIDNKGARSYTLNSVIKTLDKWIDSFSIQQKNDSLEGLEKFLHAHGCFMKWVEIKNIYTLWMNYIEIVDVYKTQPEFNSAYCSDTFFWFPVESFLRCIDI
jgi:hypothetical protein